MIIYPPFIGDTIPAFTTSEIKVPFTMNPAVSEEDVDGFALLIKDYITSNIVVTLFAAWADVSLYDESTKSGIIIFSTSGSSFTPEALLYYKFLLGYLEKFDNNERYPNDIYSDFITFIEYTPKPEDNEINKLKNQIIVINKIGTIITNSLTTDDNYGKFEFNSTNFGTLNPADNIDIYYGNVQFSIVAIGRCIGTAPNISIKDLNNNVLNNEQGIYTGVVSENTEKIYSYRFKLFDSNNNILEDSGEILNIDNSYKYKLKYNLNDNTKKILFFIKTINGYEGESSKYNLQNITTLPEYSIIATSSSFEEGYILLTFESTEQSSSLKYYLLERTIDLLHFEELVTFKIAQDQIPTQKDYSVEQGIKYYYSIREVDENGIYLSARKIIEEPISVDYEDIILAGLDGKVLKIKFDPKVSSFKNTILESKTDTIGNKYPFFFRNGNINYKEIPISGLISYHMDDIKKFMTDEELGFPYIIETAAAGLLVTPDTESVGRSINLDGPNIAAERKFRLAVLDWLSNGEPKLFRSPTEGVYVIRLMNVSLSPNDTLGRMLYSFSATGYEVSDHDVETLVNKKYVSFIEDYTQASSRLGWFILGISRLGEEEE